MRGKIVECKYCGKEIRETKCCNDRDCPCQGYTDPPICNECEEKQEKEEELKENSTNP